MSAMAGEGTSAEFSRIVPVEQIGKEGLSLEMTASPAEREALARRFSITAIDSLSALAHLRPGRAGAVRADVSFAADVEQACVVTLEPVTSHIEESFAVTYAPEGEPPRGEVVVDVEAEEPPEQIVGGRIEIGEMLAQHLALALDPYPRKPGLPPVEESYDEGPAEARGPETPFAALAKLKKRD